MVRLVFIWNYPLKIKVMKRCAALVFLALMPAAHADGPDLPPDFPEEIAESANLFHVLSLGRAAAIVEQRFDGKLIAARLVPPMPHEAQNGVQLVYELRLLTPRRNVIQIRLDARNGAFLEAAGAGLGAARRKD